MTYKRVGRRIIRQSTDVERSRYRDALEEESAGVEANKTLGREFLAERPELGAIDESAATRPSIRFGRFSLSSLLLAMAIASVVLAWAVLSPVVIVRAKLQAKANPQMLVGGQPNFSPQEYADFRRNLIQDIHSDWILMAVLRDPRIAGLGPIQQSDDPVKWLRRSLIVDFPSDSEILTISLKASEESKNDTIALLDALVNTFVREELSRDRLQQISRRDSKTRAAEDLKEQILRLETQPSTAQSNSNATGAINLFDEKLKTLRQQLHTLVTDAERDDINLRSEPRIVVLVPATSSRY